MLTNKEYANYHKVPEQFDSPLMDEFAAFTVLVPTQKGEVDLWKVKRATKESRKKIRKQTKAALLEKYILQGYAFDEQAVTNPGGGAISWKECVEEIDSNPTGWEG